MIICEECGAYNRNDDYVCAACGASLLHLEATGDDEAVPPAPSRRKAPLFGRKARQRDVEGKPASIYDAGEDVPEPVAVEPDDPPPYRDEPEEDAAPVRRGLFGRKARQRDVEEEPASIYDAGEDVPEPAAVEPDDPPPYRDEPEEGAAPVRRGLFGRKARQRDVEEEPEYIYDAGEDVSEPAAVESDDPPYQDEPEEGAAPVRRGLFGRKARQRDVEEEPEYIYDAGENVPEPAEVEPDDPPYRDEPEEDAAPDTELRFVFEEPADGAPGVESGYEPDDPRAGEGEPDVAEAGYEAGEMDAEKEAESECAAVLEVQTPETVSDAEEEKTDRLALQDEMPGDSIEIEAPERAGARPTRSQTMHVHVARVKTDRYRTMENAVPSRISVDVDEEDGSGESYDEPYDESDEPERMTRGMIAAIVTVASLLVVTMVVLGVLLVGKSRSVPAAASGAPATVTDTAPVEAPTPSPVVTPSPTPIPTTNPE